MFDARWMNSSNGHGTDTTSGDAQRRLEGTSNASPEANPLGGHEDATFCTAEPQWTWQSIPPHLGGGRRSRGGDSGTGVALAPQTSSDPSAPSHPAGGRRSRGGDAGTEVSSAEYTVALLSIAYWLCMIILAIVFLMERVENESPDFWQLLHIGGSSGVLLIATLLGIHFELVEVCGFYARQSIIGGRQSHVGPVRHEFCHRVMQLFLFLCAGCFVSVGPSTTAESNGTDLFVLGAGRVLCISGALLGTARVIVGCFKHRFRMHDQQRREAALLETDTPGPREVNPFSEN